MVTGLDIVKEARTWLNTPFRHQARLKGVGVDCLGVVIGVCKALKLAEGYDDITNYSRRPNSQKIQAEIIKYGVPINLSDSMPGDIGLFKFTKEPQHFAIFTDIGILHAYSDAGKCIEHGFDGIWENRLVQVYRLKELV